MHRLQIQHVHALQHVRVHSTTRVLFWLDEMLIRSSWSVLQRSIQRPMFDAWSRAYMLLPTRPLHSNCEASGG